MMMGTPTANQAISQAFSLALLVSYLLWSASTLPRTRQGTQQCRPRGLNQGNLQQIQESLRYEALMDWL
jgi:hypothetical protein